MSVEAKRWLDCPKDFRREVKRFLKQDRGKEEGENKLSRLLNGRAFVVVREENKVIGVTPIDDEEEEKSLVERMRNGSSQIYFIVRGLKNSGKSPRQAVERDDQTLENAEMRRGYLKGKYRGKHRSETKGVGMMHNFRDGFHKPKNFRGKRST